MVKSILQARIADRGLVLDPRTKMLLLLTMSVFVLGYAGGGRPCLPYAGFLRPAGSGPNLGKKMEASRSLLRHI